MSPNEVTLVLMSPIAETATTTTRVDKLQGQDGSLRTRPSNVRCRSGRRHIPETSKRIKPHARDLRRLRRGVHDLREKPSLAAHPR